MHFGAKRTNNDDNVKKIKKKSNFPHKAQILLKNKRRAKALGAFLLSAALVIGLVPFIAPNENIPETQAAQVAKVSFEDKTKAEVEEMMKHMTIDEIVDAMPLKDKVSQLFVTYSGDVYSGTASSPMASYTSLSTAAKSRLASYPVGGICYFLGDIKSQSQIQSVSQSFQDSNKYGMFLAVDEEGGRVQRVGGTTYDGATRGAGIGTQINAMYTYKDQGTSVAKSNAMALANNLLMTGMNWDFAPVADTNSNPNNTVIGYRAYSNDYNQAAELVSAAISGFHEKNVMTSIKHFPGHGDTSTDSHAGAALVNKKISQLMTEDLIPFKAGIAAGTDSIMLGHLSYIQDDGSLSSDDGLIATNSSDIITGLLREQLGYDGIVITDGMQMGALTNLYGKESTTLRDGFVTGKKYNGYITAAIDYFIAGGDMFLLCGTPFQAIDAIIAEVNAGTISEDRIDESVTRVMKAKRQYNIIPTQEDDAEATYISSDGAMEHGTFAAMWSKASTETLQSGKPAPVVRLNKNVTASSSGSFGTGTNIASNGDLTLTANHSVTVDLNGFTLNKNLSGSSSADGKHIFNIPANATVTIRDSSSAQDGKITSAGGSTGTVAYATGANAKFIVDSGTITGNTGTSLVYGDANAVMRLGIQDVDGNNAGPINITGNTVEYAVDFSGTMYLMGETSINNNGGANLYFNGSNSIVNIQDRGLTGGTGTIGVTVSNTRAANVDLFKPAGGVTLTGNDLNALFYDDDTYQLELDTNIKLVKVDGDVRFTSADGSISDTGTWDEMWTLSQTKDGTLTVLKDLNISYTTNSAADNKYVNKKNTTIQLNGKKLVVSSNNGRFINNEAGTLTISDRGVTNKKEEQVSQASDEASFNRESRLLTYYEDRLNGSALETYKVVEDLSAVGMISFSTTNKYAGNPEADGIIQNAGGTVNITGGVLTSEHSRGITAKTNTTVNMSGGYIVDCNSWGHASGIWAFGANAVVNISGGVIACNHSYGATSGSSGALGIYSSTAKAVITGGLFTGNTSLKNGAAIGMANNDTATSLSVSNATICHNTSPDGAGIYANSASAVNIVDSLISSNESSTSGGGIYMNGSTIVNLSGSTAVMNNKATTSAGGIYNATSGKLSIKDSIIVKDNIANGAKSDIAVITNGNKVSVNGILTSPSRSIGIDLPNAAPGNVFATGSGYTVQASDAGKFFIDGDKTLFGSLDGNNNIYLEQGEAQYVSPDGNMENGDLKALWTKYFTAGTSGTITLMKDVTLSDDSQLVLETKASQAKLDLNGKNLVLTNNRTDNESPIYVPSGSFEICDSSATASTMKTVVDVPAGTRAILSDDLDKLTYYTTEHEQNGIITYKNDVDLSVIGHIRYTGGSDPNGIVHVGTSGTFTLTNGLLNCTNGRAILNGMSSGTCTSKVNINGGYIAGCKAGLASVLLARNGSTTNINGGVIAGNTNPTGRGTVWMNIVGMNTLSMTGGIISGNYAKGGTAEQGGGAILVEYSNTSATITGGMITHNSTDANGGGICYATAAPDNGLSISDVVISANKSSKNGGGIYSGRNINDPNCHIDANEASVRGGAIYTTAGLIANSLCASENIAAQSAGIYAANGITMKGKISIEDNVTSDGTASNLDIEHLSADKVQIVGALESGSKIGLSIAKNASERNQKVVSSTIDLNDSYSNMFYDDADENHVLRFNDGSDGLYLIQEDIEGDELGAQETAKLEKVGGGVIHRQAANMSWSGNGANQNMQHLLVGTGKALTSNFGAWSRYIFTFDSEIQKYQCTQIVPIDTTNWPNSAITLGTNQVMFCSYPATSGLDPNFSVGDYVDFDFVPTATEKSSTNGIGNYTVYSYTPGPATVTYNIHYVVHYPVSDVMTGEYYVEDQSRLVEATGVVGQLVYAPYDDIAGYLDTDSHNVISKTLQEDKAMGGPDWYYKDENFQGMHGSADSINDLYVIYEHSEEEYFYNVEYYDTDTGQLIKTDEKLSASTFPIKATTSMKTLYEYEYDADNTNNVDTIESASDNMVLKLYFKKWPTYTVEYYDADTMEKLDEDVKATHVSKPVQPGSAVSLEDLSDSLKTIDGYEYVNKDGYTVESIESVNQDGSSKLKLYFEKIIYRPYTIEYYDKNTGELVGIVEKSGKSAAKTGTTVTLAESDEEYVIVSENVKYCIANDDARNVTSIEIPRTGDVPVMKVYCEQVKTAKVDIQRFEYNGNSWVQMGFKESVTCNANSDFSIMLPENKTQYVDNVTGYVFVRSDPSNGTVHVGDITDLTPVIKLYYAKISGTNAVQKTPNDNGLTPIERADTSQLININLFNYDSRANSIIPSNTYATTNYPLFRWSQPIVSGQNIKGTDGLDATGELAITDYTIDNPIAGGIMTSNGKKAADYVGANKHGINNLVMGHYKYQYASGSQTLTQNSYANTPLNGYNTINGSNYTTPMSMTVGSDGKPQLSTGESLGYLFPDEPGTSQYATKINDSNINYLFEYDEETGTYSYNSQKNHAQYNSETGNFDVYDKVISPNVFCYQFGNFLPFQDINSQATSFTKLDKAYFERQAQYAQYKANIAKDTQEKKMYQNVATKMTNMLASNGVLGKISGDIDYQDMINMYWGGHQYVPDYAVDLETGVNDVAPGVTYDDFYMIDYDELKDFFFGISFDMNFVQPSKGLVGKAQNPMQFNFEGDDDVLIYIDDMLFLNLSGIHRQVGGKINFAEGKVYYGDLNHKGQNSADHNAECKTDYIGYPNNSSYVKTFREIMLESGMSTSEVDNLLNENGTFKDWTQHSFAMYYMERGSGSGIMSLDFNLPVVPDNTLLVAKNITNQNPDYQPILSDPFFKMQFVKCNEDGEVITYVDGDKKGTAVPYLEEGTPYMIYEDGAYTGRTRYVDENGIITLRSNQFAVISGVAKPGEIYCVRELIDQQFVEQFDKTTVTNNTIFGGDKYPTAVTVHESTTTTPENSVWYPDENGKMVNYLIRASYPMRTDGHNLSSTLFENNLNLTQLGAIALTKDIVEGDTAWSEDDKFNFAVTLDGRPLPLYTAANTHTAYYVYPKAYDEAGNLIIDGTGTKREVEHEGVVTIAPNEVAVLRYMLAGSEYEIYEIDNPDAGNYHPVYNKDENGNNIYSGQVSVGSIEHPMEFGISNQRADNLEISKVVENLSDGFDKDYTFEVSISADDRHIDDTYEYEIFSIDDEIDSTAARELVDRDTAVAVYQEYLATGDSLDMNLVRPNRSTITFTDGKASLSLKANQKIVIYGLPYQCNYTVTETNTNGEYQAFYRGTNMNEFSNGETATFVLDSKSNDVGAASTVEFKNRKVEDLSVSKKVEVDVLDALLGKYEKNFKQEFTFNITDATYQGTLLNGEYAATVTDTYTKTEDGSDKVRDEIVTFIDGEASFALSHGQTMTIHGLPNGTTYVVSEEGNPAYRTSYKIGEDTLTNQSTNGSTVPEQVIGSDNQVHFTNSLILSGLPTTGGVGLIVIALALIGSGIFIIANARRRQIHNKIRNSEGNWDVNA